MDRVVGPLTSRELESSGYSLLCFCYKFRYKARYQNFEAVLLVFPEALFSTGREKRSQFAKEISGV